MPADPFVVAKATRTFAVVSKTPTAAVAGTSRAGGRIETEAPSAMTSASAVDVPRAVTIVHGTLPSAAASSPTMKSPNASAATSARTTPAASGVRLPAPGSRASSTMPPSTAAMPAHWAAEGETPRPRSTASGTTGLAAEIGATIPIAPTAIPRYSAARPIAPHAPAPTAGRRSPTPGTPSPDARSHTTAPPRPIAWESTSTVSTWIRRAATPPRKSPVPQDAAPRSARAATAIDRQWWPTGRVAATASSWFAW